MKTSANIQQIIEDIIVVSEGKGAAQALTACGVTAGEISQRDAIRVYKSWFKDMVKAGEIRPVRIGEGATATRWYKVSDILELKQKQNLLALAQLSTL